MKEVILDVQTRELGAKNKLSALRKEEKIPAVFYGKNIAPESITVDAKTFMSIIAENGANVIIDLNFKNGKKPAIVKSLQRDVLTQSPIHIDFQAISLEDKVEVLVPIHIEGVADGVKNFGGVMEFIVREVRVKALPKSIPQKISIDVSTLGLGQGITIADLPKLENVDYVQELSTLIVNVIAVAVEEEKPKEETAETTQPEVISKGKKDKEEGAETASASSVQKK
ncbi:MAG: 50S ribosomal protein L25 [Endomicrobium sp.]|jgi:large subunit ribosomal protein L25|uniref:50S ribosomal protein L25 n=1 Tax=Candidatus Endomicrobiellum cubanum TaxID=3242325 RepID=UPI00281F9438|nr:50S ribosomal protein L25 [Endomicrobium sp.]